LQELSRKRKLPFYATHLVYLSNADNERSIEQNSVQSILRSPEKRADIYWFVHIQVTDEPYTMEYSVRTLALNDIYHLTLYLGFRVEPKVDLMFRSIVNDLKESHDLMLEHSANLKYNIDPRSDYLFMLGDSYLSPDNDISQVKYFLLQAYYLLRKISVRKERNYGLETSNVITEKYPLVVSPISNLYLRRQKE